MNVSGSLKVLLTACCAGVASPVSAVEVQPLEVCREVGRLWMGMEEGVIRPATFEQFRADSEGYVALLATDGQLIAKGGHWATLDPEQLEIERRTLEVDRVKQEQLRLKARDDAKEARVRMSLELHEAEGKRGDLAVVARDAEVPETLRQRIGEALSKVDEQIAALRVRQQPENLERDLQLLDEDNELQIARKQRQLLMLEKRSHLIAGSEGKLLLGDAVKQLLATGQEGEPMWMKAGDLIGTIVDDQRYEISVSAAGPLLAAIPQDELLVFLQDSQTGGLIAGEYARTDEFDNGREISRNYVFTIREDGVEGARQAQGTRSLVHVYRKFPRPYRLVYKKDIAFLVPDVLEKSGWDGLVRHLWPGSKVIQVGPQTIAVEPKDAN